jgi:Lar family restriction alleviation protein
MNDVELKPCPLCGGNAKITGTYYDGKREYVDTISCKSCHLSVNRIWSKGMPFQTEVDVLEKWNNRSVN